MNRILLAVVIVACSCIALAGCGGGDDDGAQDGGAPTEATTAEPTSRPITTLFTVEVGEVTIRGHCTGSRAAGVPAVILQHGNGGNKNDLRSIEAFLAGRTQVCAYDRPGAVDGRSDVPSNLPRPVTNLVSEAHDVLVAAEIEPPYFVFGFSAGAMIAFMFAQAYPDETVGFVAINPVPPYTAWIEEATKVQTPEELEREEADYRGSNPESIDYTANDGMLNDSLPATMPYAVMFDEDCGGDTEFCGRVLEPLAATTELLTDVSEGGRFQWVKGAGHDIDLTRPEEVKQTIDEIWAEAVD